MNIRAQEIAREINGELGAMFESEIEKRVDAVMKSLMSDGMVPLNVVEEYLDDLQEAHEAELEELRGGLQKVIDMACKIQEVKTRETEAENAKLKKRVFSLQEEVTGLRMDIEELEDYIDELREIAFDSDEEEEEEDKQPLCCKLGHCGTDKCGGKCKGGKEKGKKEDEDNIDHILEIIAQLELV